MNRIYILFAFLFFITFSCKKLERVNPKDGIAGVTTSEANQLSFSSVEINTNLNKVDGVAYVTQRGICFSKNQNPSTSDLFTNNGSGFGSFTSKIEGLSANTTYYFRSFASNDKAIAYGNEVSFKINAPFIKTKSATSISYTQATIGYSLINPENVSISEKGMFWGVYPGITEQNTKIITDKTDVDYTLSNLENGKTYYYKPFASTNYGYVFGEELSFNTLGYNTPSLSTTQVTSIGEYTAISGGEISSDGGLPITAKGICWSTTNNPTINNNKTNEGSGTAAFKSQLSALSSGTTYYVRSYATNSKGTSYGNEVSFKTYVFNKPTLTTNNITDISKLSAISGGKISSDGGMPITSKGICWSTTSNPTISNSKTNEGGGLSNFISNLSGLSSGTTYYVRAYATNAKGTSYGNEVSFKTLSNSSSDVTDIEGNTYKIVTIGSQTWMAENLKTSKYNDGTVIPNITDNNQWTSLTTGAWAYYNNDAANNTKYGKLYNLYAVSSTTNGNKNVCPTGWHVPTDAEWTVLIDYLGGTSVAGGKMKEVGTTSWSSPNTDATNTSLFTGLPGGYRLYNGYYYVIGSLGYWWSSTEYGTSLAWLRSLNANGGGADSGYNGKKYGFSVRCLRD